jgi:hypothetical protein
MNKKQKRPKFTAAQARKRRALWKKLGLGEPHFSWAGTCLEKLKLPSLR